MSSKQFVEKEWGIFRLYIAAHPLTGFIIGVGAGAVVVSAAWRLFG